MKPLLALVCLFLFSPSLAFADYQHARPDSHAPIGVMGDHTHKEGEFMLSYRYGFMKMDGNRDGSSSVSTAGVLSDFMVSPLEMDMEMHMLGGMFAPSDWLTLMFMVPYLDISMDHVNRMGREFSTQTSGLGDVKLTSLWRVYENDHHHVHINSGLSLPSGEIDETDDTPAGADSHLPYAMQLGSGTFDLMPGVTYTGQCERVSWGAQGIGTVRIDRNDNDYALGDRFDSSVWFSYFASEWFSPSLRLTWSKWGNVDGQDLKLNPMMVPTADAHRRAGEQSDIGVGLNFMVREGALRSLRIATEFLFPIYRHLDGPQLETDWKLVTGVQYAF